MTTTVTVSQPMESLTAANMSEPTCPNPLIRLIIRPVQTDCAVTALTQQYMVVRQRQRHDSNCTRNLGYARHGNSSRKHVHAASILIIGDDTQTFLEKSYQLSQIQNTVARILACLIIPVRLSNSDSKMYTDYASFSGITIIELFSVDTNDDATYHVGLLEPLVST
uniref:Uncharacterized protein n=1 Tax=Talaromyces marneffei PM1 TaxID=1077442 RepID=A0A093VFX9_TALMA